jgi:squalene-hopene/tetraprenyl-beta-curcumene cyclase
MTDLQTKASELLAITRTRLVAEIGAHGHWEGALSSSALSTAIAVFALAEVDRDVNRKLIERGLDWLTDNINADGGWGDTTASKSNISTSLLCWAALSLSDSANALHKGAVKKVEGWLTACIGNISPPGIADAILKHYGKDRTFAVPILSMCALSGRLGPTLAAWEFVPQLPFEFAVLPRRLFKWLQLGVVSYALPALIAIGIVKHRHDPINNPLLRFIRNLVETRAMAVLTGIQPLDGGFLEATPLTGFVVMNLAASGYRDHVVTSLGVKFLVSSAREDGSWPIDTNLATWVTTLAVNALSESGAIGEHLGQSGAGKVREWLESQQYKVEHPYTLAPPGGWGWTDLPGGVPDADDTAGALLALRRFGPADAHIRTSATAGIEWLLDVQNRDGGFPTFCKGWGKLPFDRSCPDVTAHALRALDEWYDDVVPSLRSRIDNAMQNGMDFLSVAQDDEDSWSPLWFGNENAQNWKNVTFGTAQVVRALCLITPERLPKLDVLVETGWSRLLSLQNADGGWGGGVGVKSTIEETALAIDALAGSGNNEVISRGVDWLVEHTDGGRRFDPAPIGLYFSSLWYHEKLYPMIFVASALGHLTNEVKPPL